MLDAEPQSVLLATQVQVRIAPGMKFRAAAQLLARPATPTSLLGVVHDDDGELQAPLKIAQVAEQRCYLCGVVLVDAVQADKRIEECVNEVYDAIALPGGMPGAEHLRDSTPLVDMVKKQKQEGRLYAAICASPAVVFQHHGFLAGQKATCHPAFVKHLENQEAVENRVVVDGMCVTSRGPGTAIEFALQLITLLFDQEQAEKVSGPMLVLG